MTITKFSVSKLIYVAFSALIIVILFMVGVRERLVPAIHAVGYGPRLDLYYMPVIPSAIFALMKSRLGEMNFFSIFLLNAIIFLFSGIITTSAELHFFYTGVGEGIIYTVIVGSLWALISSALNWVIYKIG
jgi:hypothetical protein